MPAANHLLHRLIRETGWTYEALARRLNTSARAVGPTTGYDRTPVAHWLRGSTARAPDAVRAFVAAQAAQVHAAREIELPGPGGAGLG